MKSAVDVEAMVMTGKLYLTIPHQMAVLLCFDYLSQVVAVAISNYLCSSLQSLPKSLYALWLDQVVALLLHGPPSFYLLVFQPLVFGTPYFSPHFLALQDLDLYTLPVSHRGPAYMFMWVKLPLLTEVEFTHWLEVVPLFITVAETLS